MRDGKVKGEWTFQPCFNSSHATMLPPFPISFPSMSLIGWREIFWVTGMSNKAGTDMGNSCTALGQHQQCAPSADVEFHLHGRHGEWHPRLFLAVVEAVVSRYSSSWWHCCFNQFLSQIQVPPPCLPSGQAGTKAYIVMQGWTSSDVPGWWDREKEAALLRQPLSPEGTYVAMSREDNCCLGELRTNLSHTGM